MSVTPGTTRWAELVRMGQGVVSNRNWMLGDAALEIFPVGVGHGGDRSKSDSGPTCEELLAQYADEVGVSLATIQKCRYTANAWTPAERTFNTSWKVYQLLLGNKQHIKDGMTTTEASLALGQSNPGRIQSERDKDIEAAVAAAKVEVRKEIEAEVETKVAAQVKVEVAKVEAKVEARVVERVAAIQVETAQVVEASQRETEEERAKSAAALKAKQAEVDRAKAESAATKRAPRAAENIFRNRPTEAAYEFTAREVELAMREDGVHKDQLVTYKVSYETAFTTRWNELVLAYTERRAEERSREAAAKIERARLAAIAVIEGIDNAFDHLEANVGEFTTAHKDRAINLAAAAHSVGV